jgi:hypothetical protein
VASASAHQECDNAVLCALKVECGRTIQGKPSHAMQNSPDFVHQGINLGGCGAFRD